MAEILHAQVTRTWLITRVVFLRHKA